MVAYTIGRLQMDKKKILMIDDVPFNHKMAEDVLKDEFELYKAVSAKEGFQILAETIPDLILLDIVMPVMDGFGMLKILKNTPAYKDIPVIFLTSDTKPEDEVSGFNEGIVDYINKPFIPEVMIRRIHTQIELSEYRKDLERKVDEKVSEIEDMYDIITASFAGLVESRDGVTGGHLKNTSIYYKAFINALKENPKYKRLLPDSFVKRACRSAPLHDVGKIAIEDVVLRKAGSLNGEEFERMKLHSVIGGDIFAFLKKRIADKEYGEIAENVARYHHERWDGAGYPAGLKGEEIPLEARIMSIVDVYDALTSERPYKHPYSHEKSMAIIADGSGIEFDPDLVEEFIKIGETINACLRTKEAVLADQNFFMYGKRHD